MLLAWGSPTAPCTWFGGPDSPRQARASAHPLYLVPPPLGGAPGTESWLWWGNHRPLPPPLQAAEDILEGGRERRPGPEGWGAGRPRLRCSASLVALRDQAPRPRVAALCAVARALGVLGLPLQHPPRGGWAFPTSGGAVRGRERPQQRSGFLGHTPQATLGPLGRVVLGGCWHLGDRGRDSRHPLRPLCSEMSSPEPSGRDGLLREEPCPARWQVGTL